MDTIVLVAILLLIGLAEVKVDVMFKRYTKGFFPDLYTYLRANLRYNKVATRKSE